MSGQYIGPKLLHHGCIFWALHTNLVDTRTHLKNGCLAYKILRFTSQFFKIIIIVVNLKIIGFTIGYSIGATWIYFCVLSFHLITQVMFISIHIFMTNLEMDKKCSRDCSSDIYDFKVLSLQSLIIIATIHQYDF